MGVTRLLLTVLISTALSGGVLAQAPLPSIQGFYLEPNDPHQFLKKRLEIDRALSLWYSVPHSVKDAQLDRFPMSQRQALERVFNDRQDEKRRHSEVIDAIVYADREDSLLAQGMSRKQIERLTNRARVVPRDTRARGKLLKEYQQLELESAERFAKQVASILTAEQLEVFLRLPAKNTEFVTHPFGKIFLKLSDSQVKGVEKELSLLRSRMAKVRAITSEEFENQRKKAETQIRIQLKAEARKVLAEVREIQFRIFGTLTSEQLLKYLRLSEEIASDDDLHDWFASLAKEELEIARKHIQIGVPHAR